MPKRKTIEDLRRQLIELERTANSKGFQPLAAILHLAILEADNMLGQAPTPLTLPGSRH